MNAIKIIVSERMFFYIKILHFFFENIIICIYMYFKFLFNRSNLLNNRKNSIHNNLHTIYLKTIKS